jgi:predicted ATPase
MLAVDGAPVRGERLATVVRALLDARGRPVPASSLVNAVWGADEPRDATGAVQALVSRVRRLGLAVVAVPGGYRLPTEDLSIDAVEAAGFVQLARSCLHDGNPSAARAQADQARALLPEAPDVTDPTVRAVLHEVATVRALAALEVHAVGDAGEVDLRRLAGATPPDEQAAELLLRLLAAAGRNAEALEFAEALRRELADRYGADLSPALAEAHVALLRGELSTVESKSPPAAMPLPAGWRRSATPLLGREADLTTVAAELAHAPLVTVVGPGGAGKTRLAAEVARRMAGAGARVRVVELAGLRSADQVAGTVATTIEGAERGVRPAETPLWTDGGEHPVRRAARDFAGLVVLDNCEHVLDAAADAAAQILAVASAATVLATSRAPLGLPAEVVHRLRPLNDADAVALLQARARAGGAVPDWPTDLLQELCHRVDNLPLAIELAAARLRHMPVDDVLAGLTDRFGILDEALRGLPDRHASLWAMVDWSHDLLAFDQRRLWWRLAVLPAPFTVDTAAAVAGTADVRAPLAALVEQSLLSLGRGDDGEPRYRMLETVREYGDVRLDAAGERADAMAGLVAWAAGHAVALAPDFIGPAQVPALSRCAADADIMAAALRWATDNEDDVSTVDIARALFHLWTVQGRHWEVVDWASRMLHTDDLLARRRSAIVNGTTVASVLPDGDRLAWTLLMVGVNATVLGSGRPNRLAAIARRSLRHLFAQRPEQVSARSAALAWVPTTIDLGDPEQGFAIASRLADHPDMLVQGFGLFLRSILWVNLAEDEPALADNLAAFDRFEAVGDQWMMGMAAEGIAARLSAASRPGAQEWLRRAESHLRRVGAAEDARSMRVMLDVQLALDGDVPAQQRLAEVAAAQTEPIDAATARGGLAELAIRQGQHDEALAQVETMAAVAQAATGQPQAMVIIRCTAAVLRVWVAQAAAAGDQDAERFAAAQLRVARDPALSTGDIPTIGGWALAGAELAAHRGSDDLARALWALALRLSARVVYPFQERHGPRLAQVLAEPAQREAVQARSRNQPSAAIIVEVRELMATLLG